MPFDSCSQLKRLIWCCFKICYIYNMLLFFLIWSNIWFQIFSTARKKNEISILSSIFVNLVYFLSIWTFFKFYINLIQQPIIFEAMFNDNVKKYCKIVNTICINDKYGNTRTSPKGSHPVFTTFSISYSFRDTWNFQNSQSFKIGLCRITYASLWYSITLSIILKAYGLYQCNNNFMNFQNGLQNVIFNHTMPICIWFLCKNKLWTTPWPTYIGI